MDKSSGARRSRMDSRTILDAVHESPHSFFTMEERPNAKSKAVPLFPFLQSMLFSFVGRLAPFSTIQRMALVILRMYQLDFPLGVWAFTSTGGAGISFL